MYRLQICDICDIFTFLSFAKKPKKNTCNVTKTWKCHKVQNCDIVTFEKCHKMSHNFKSLVQSYVYLLCLDPARNGSEVGPSEGRWTGDERGRVRRAMNGEELERAGEEDSAGIQVCARNINVFMQVLWTADLTKFEKCTCWVSCISPVVCGSACIHPLTSNLELLSGRCTRNGRAAIEGREREAQGRK